jgi:hypothetical protein
MLRQLGKSLYSLFLIGAAFASVISLCSNAESLALAIGRTCYSKKDQLMIVDPLAIQNLDAVTPAGEAFQLSLKDLSLGRTVRSYSGTSILYTMTIGHSESKENPSQVTDRSAVRFDGRKTLVTGLPSTAQATLTVSIPRNGWTPAEVGGLIDCLIATLYSVVDGSTDTVLLRVLQGEP